MKRALTWIGLVLGALLLGGGLTHIGLSNTLLIAQHERPQGQQSIDAVQHFNVAPRGVRTPGDQ